MSKGGGGGVNLESRIEQSAGLTSSKRVGEGQGRGAQAATLFWNCFSNHDGDCPSKGYYPLEEPYSGRG